MQRFLKIFGVLIFIYLIGYAPARVYAFGMVEHYPAGKGGPRRDYMRVKNEPFAKPLFRFYRPVIALETTLQHWLARPPVV